MTEHGHMDLEERLPLLARMKSDAAEAQRRADDLKADAKVFERDVFDIMVATGFSSHRHAAHQYVRVSTPFGYVKAGDEDAFDEWLAENDLVEEYTEPKYRRKALNELARQLREDGIPEEDWPPGFGIDTTDYVSVRKG